MIRIAFTIKALEDLHIGEGINKAGLYDDGTAKDSQGNPAIESETFKGLLRQSLLEVVADSIPKNKDTNESFYKMLFSYKQQNSPDILIRVDPRTLQDETFVINTYTAIDDQTRKAQRQSLRSLECVRKGTVFNGELSYHYSDNKSNKGLVNFLKKGLENITWIGSHRRRGLGAVEIKVQKSIQTPDGTSGIMNVDSGAKQIALVLELLDDVTIAGAGQLGNHFFTLDHIPGTSMLGMLRVAFGRLNPDALPCLADNSCRIQNFYPLPPSQDIRELMQEEAPFPFICPIPLSARKRKASDLFGNTDSAGGLPHWCYRLADRGMLAEYLVSDQAIDTASDATEFASKSFRGGYLIKQDKVPWRYYHPATTLRLRNRVDSLTQKTSTDSLITQDCLSKGNRFIGLLDFNNFENTQIFVKGLRKVLQTTPYLHVGRGSKPVSVLACYAPSFFTSPSKSKKVFLRLVCVSDVILPDKNLNYCHSIDPEYLAEQLSLANGQLKLVKQFSTTRIIHNFHGLAGIRRFGIKAISKGSVFVYDCNGANIGEKAMKELESVGIGLRTNEGYGRIVFDLDLGDVSQHGPQLREINPPVSQLAAKYEQTLQEAERIAGEMQYAGRISPADKNKLYQLLLRKTDPQIIRTWLVNGTKHNTDKKESFEILLRFFNKYKLKADQEFYDKLSRALDIHTEGKE